MRSLTKELRPRWNRFLMGQTSLLQDLKQDRVKSSQQQIRHILPEYSEREAPLHPNSWVS